VKANEDAIGYTAVIKSATNVVHLKINLWYKYKVSICGGVHTFHRSTSKILLCGKS
jgi:hypothetical protein